MVLPQRHPGDFQPAMTIKKGRRFKLVCFTIQGTSSFAVSFYFYYLYFLMQNWFGFGDKQNLALAALARPDVRLRLVAGRAVCPTLRLFHRAENRIRHHAVRAGRRLATALRHRLDPGQPGAFNVGMCFLWPTIEALVSEGEDAEGLPRPVGTYNVVWAATNALALVRRRHARGKIRVQNHFLHSLC